MGQSFALERDHLAASFFEGFFKPLERLIVFTQSAINTSNTEWRNELAPFELEKSFQGLVSIVTFACNAVSCAKI